MKRGKSSGTAVVVGFAAVAYYFCAFGPVSARIGEKLCGLLLGTSVILAVMALIEAATGWNLWNNTGWRYLKTPRVVATLDNPAVLGTYLAIAVSVALIVVFWGGPQRLRKLAIAVVLISPPALVFTYTRGPVLGLLAVAAPVLLLRRSIRAKSVGVSRSLRVRQNDHLELRQVRVSQLLGADHGHRISELALEHKARSTSRSCGSQCVSDIRLHRANHTRAKSPPFISMESIPELPKTL